MYKKLTPTEYLRITLNPDNWKSDSNLPKTFFPRLWKPVCGNKCYCDVVEEHAGHSIFYFNGKIKVPCALCARAFEQMYPDEYPCMPFAKMPTDYPERYAYGIKLRSVINSFGVLAGISKEDVMELIDGSTSYSEKYIKENYTPEEYEEYLKEESLPKEENFYSFIKESLLGKK